MRNNYLKVQDGISIGGFIIMPLNDSHELSILNPKGECKIVSLEPRIMKVFQILYDNQGQVISREYIKDKIWGNYGGAEDALTQAISKLRKEINIAGISDKFIETVPKKGYRLNGVITYENHKNPLFNKKISLNLTTFIIAIAILIFGSFYFFFIHDKNDSKIAPKAPVHQQLN